MVIFKNWFFPVGSWFHLFPVGFNYLSSSIVTNATQFNLFSCRYFVAEIAIKCRNIMWYDTAFTHMNKKCSEDFDIAEFEAEPLFYSCIQLIICAQITSSSYVCEYSWNQGVIGLVQQLLKHWKSKSCKEFDKGPQEWLIMTDAREIQSFISSVCQGEGERSNLIRACKCWGRKSLLVEGSFCLQRVKKIQYMAGKARKFSSRNGIMFWTLEIIYYKKFLPKEMIDITGNATLSIFLKATLHHKCVESSEVIASILWRKSS